MSRRSASEDHDLLDEDDVEEEDEEEPEERPRRRKAPHRGRAPPRPRPRPMRSWDSGTGHARDEATEVEEARLRAHRPRAVYWRFRDSFLFAPLVAILVIALVLGGLLAYTQTWPPIYVVESSSMQHGPNDVLGVINAGDLVLSQKTSIAGIVTYVDALSTGYQTYGEYGDVLLYEPNGQGGTPIIHRALVYLSYDPANGTYDAPSLAGLPCGSSSTNGFYYTATTSLGSCGPYGMVGTLTLYHVGWRGASVPVQLGPTTTGTHSGYVTLGDDNFQNRSCSSSACVGEIDQSPLFKLSQLVSAGWTLGVARGLVPWFGGVRLLLTGNAGEVPAQSWELMALTIVAVILAGFALHYAWKSFRPPDRRRAAEEEQREREEEDEDGGDGNEEEATPRRRWFHRRARGDDEERGGSGAPRARQKRNGRPAPSVWRPAGRSQRRRSRPDDEDEL